MDTKNFEQPLESDLWIPKPKDGEKWETHTIHTHYFGFSVPEEKIGVFIYVRYLPVLDVNSGGVCVFQGIDNVHFLDLEHMNYLNHMPYPVKDRNTISVANGITLDFIEPGRKVRLTYKSKDEKVHFDVLQTAVSPLFARAHVMPGEEEDGKKELTPGGTEQFMHCTGDLTLYGKTYKVDCYPARDRSWRQVRTEDEQNAPPFGWTPMYFGPDLCFNYSGWEDPDKHPIWKGVYPVEEKSPFLFAWLLVDGKLRHAKRVSREVTRYHPTLFSAMEQNIEVEDDQGAIWRFKGEAIAMAQLPSWPNFQIFDSVYKWTDEKGRVTHCAFQEAWWARFHRYRHGKTWEHIGLGKQE
ncbi:uncharacterized protein A1O9_12867 [Exophiala aquamarina CBS 119918]|uniref:Uncharacterized protein n=1 Tax=Exophiala aquamarina CBS 119918 TaxID=1182545 RepID=A0A072P632_9EURO|nr:uncharacterized protein A1O9_12867 [Exophiala aquamarina CBS 119918]KEF51085.1 hypothetical protein A1O9_12867 [Exophiala aquamarina CBS 119918]